MNKQENKQNWFDGQLLKILISILIFLTPFILGGIKYGTDLDKRMSIIESVIDQRIAPIDQKLEKIDNKLENIKEDVYNIKIENAKKDKLAIVGD